MDGNMLTTNLEDTRATQLAFIDDGYAHRDSPDRLAQSDRMLADALTDAPQSYPLLWRKARSSFWKADGTNDARETVGTAQEGIAAVDRALCTNQHGIEAHYYGALNMAMYARAVGVMRALGERLLPKFLSHLDFVLAHDESFYFYGPRITKARYHFALPWPKRDLAQSRKELERVIELCPGSLRAYLYLADTYLAEKNKAQAVRVLSTAIAGDPSYDPPEARRITQQAKALLATLRA